MLVLVADPNARWDRASGEQPPRHLGLGLPVQQLTPVRSCETLGGGIAHLNSVVGAVFRDVEPPMV